MAQPIEHEGIITEIDGNLIQVMIVQQSACDECHAKGACSISDKKEKLIEIENANPDYRIGDQVIVFGNQSIGMQAVLLAFVVPFVMVLLTLMIAGRFIANEAISGGIAIFMLLPYYFILSFFNKRLKKRLSFEIKKPFSSSDVNIFI